jgi:hypothetical protein
MNKRTVVRLDMAQRALEFSLAHPSESPGYATACKQLEELLARATVLVEEQRRGTAEVRTATIEKDRLRRALRRSHLVHFGAVAERAAAEEPELAQKFDLPRMPPRGLAFRAAARTMLELAEQRKELFSKYGMVDEVLQHARKTIDALDQAVERSAEGRRVHIGAAATLELVTDEAVRLVKILNGFNRVRFVTDTNLLAGWTAAINVIGPRRTEQPVVSPLPEPSPSPGQIKPAA